MQKQYTIPICIVLILGFITPFIDYVVIIEFMLLLIPMGLFLIASLVYLIYCFIKNKSSIKKALITFSVIPLFLLSQSTAVFIVDKIQRVKTEELIKKISKKNSSLPRTLETPIGIKYQLSKDKSYFTLYYYRGFIVKEEYNSQTKEWKNYGWND